MNDSIRKTAPGAGGKIRRIGAGRLLITQPADWYYLTGFTGESGALVVYAAHLTLITDGRFAGQAEGGDLGSECGAAATVAVRSRSGEVSGGE